MQLHQLHRALRELQAFAARTASGSPPLLHRVAMRWLQANMDLEYDRMVRLQVLEGVAGVPLRTWFGKGGKGIAAATEYFKQSGDFTGYYTGGFGSDDKKGWLALGDTGAFSLLRGILRKEILRLTRGRKMGIDPMEVIHAGLFGVPLDPSKAYKNIENLYSVGKELQVAILSGRESPQKVIAGMGSKGFRQIVQSEVTSRLRHRKLEREQEEVGEERQDQEPAAESLDSNDVWGFLAQWIVSPGDRIGDQLRHLMQKAWAGWQGEVAMNQWLDELVKRKRPPEQQEMAELVGISRPVWTQSYWQPAWARFARVLKSTPKILVEIERRFISMGYTDVDFDVSRIPDPEDISPKRTRGTRSPPKVDLRLANRFPLLPPF